MAQPGHLPTSANNALPGASAAVPAVPVLTKQQAEHQAVIMRMVAEHQRRQEEDLLQMVFRLNAAVQHQGGQVVSSEDAGAQRQGGQVVSADVLDTQEPGSQQLATGQPAASTAASAPVPGMRSGVRVVHPPGATLLQMNAARHVASIFTSGPVFGNSPTQRAQDFQAFTADTIQTFLGPSSSAGSASDPINVDIANNKRTDRAGGSGIELLESENTQEQLRTGQVNAHVLVLHVSWHNLLMRLIHLHVLCTGTVCDRLTHFSACAA